MRCLCNRPAKPASPSGGRGPLGEPDHRLDAFLGFHGQADFAAGCIDVSPRRKRVDDAAALAVALELFGDAGLGEVKSLPKGERDEALARMKERGLTVRQIQRLTGVSLGTISHA